jgi:sialate O-acetylesterase
MIRNDICNLTARYAVSLLCLVGSLTSFAELRMPQIFSDHMVLQRDMPVPVWGWGEPGAEITVRFGGQSLKSSSAADGQWQVTLSKLSASAQGRDLVVTSSSGDEKRYRDVLVGEVWLCSGQSNMELPLKRSRDSYTEVASATQPNLRLFSMKGITWTGRPYTQEQMAALESGPFFDATWTACVPETAKDFSAVAYYFGRELTKKLNVPIGLVCNAVGGSPAEAWTSRDDLASDPDLRPVLAQDWFDKLNYSWCRNSAKQSLKPWLEAVEKAKADSTTPPPQPGHVFAPAFLYDNLLKPLVPFAFQGAIWYQGESNDRDGVAYAKKFSTLIKSWRKLWQREFPFVFVQLPNFGGLTSDGVRRLHYHKGMSWALIRESQCSALSLPNTAMAVTIDLGERKDIHPKNKKDVGRRLALLARNRVYGETLLAEGPKFESMEIDGDKVILKFSNIGGGLAPQYGYLDAFSIAGEDRIFHPAIAMLQGHYTDLGRDTIVVSSEAVKNPVAVRYGWTHNPECTLYNCEPGKAWPPYLPASPFRTDDWPLPSQFYKVDSQ